MKIYTLLTTTRYTDEESHNVSVFLSIDDVKQRIGREISERENEMGESLDVYKSDNGSTTAYFDNEIVLDFEVGEHDIPSGITE